MIEAIQNNIFLKQKKNTQSDRKTWI